MLKLDPVEAEKLVRDCVCSDCWEGLTARYDPATRMSTVSCETAGCECKGTVSKHYPERREAQARAELAEATVALTRAGVLPKKSEKQLLAELGF